MGLAMSMGQATGLSVHVHVHGTRQHSFACEAAGHAAIKGPPPANVKGQLIYATAVSGNWLCLTISRC